MLHLRRSQAISSVCPSSDEKALELTFIVTGPGTAFTFSLKALVCHYYMKKCPNGFSQQGLLSVIKSEHQCWYHMQEARHVWLLWHFKIITVKHARILLSCSLKEIRHVTEGVMPSILLHSDGTVAVSCKRSNSMQVEFVHTAGWISPSISKRPLLLLAYHRALWWSLLAVTWKHVSSLSEEETRPFDAWKIEMW